MSEPEVRFLERLQPRRVRKLQIYLTVQDHERLEQLAESVKEPTGRIASRLVERALPLAERELMLLDLPGVSGVGA